ncbi:MAG: TraB/GumN family protein [Methylotenera sp.]
MFTTALKKILIGVVIAGFTFAAQATEKGLFWKLESPGGVTSYLFGTIHTDDNRVAEISPGVIAAIKQVDIFVMEVAETRDPSVMMQKEGNLASLLTEAEFEQVRELADFHVMHLGAAMQMKPWLLAVVFDLPKPQTPFAQDNLLMTKAEENLKGVMGIETAKEHFGVMDDFSLDEQMVMLRAVLKRTPVQKEADFERLMAAYLEGDSDKITALDEQITSGMLPKELWTKMRDRLLDNRNVVMAERTIKVASEKPVFVAVGASHLAGDNGLIAAFKKAGFKLSVMPK